MKKLGYCIADKVKSLCLNARITFFTFRKLKTCKFDANLIDKRKLENAGVLNESICYDCCERKLLIVKSNSFNYFHMDYD